MKKQKVPSVRLVLNVQAANDFQLDNYIRQFNAMAAIYTTLSTNKNNFITYKLDGKLNGVKICKECLLEYTDRRFELNWKPFKHCIKS